MNFFFQVGLALLLILIQVTFLPINFAFIGLVAFCLYFEELKFAPWIIFLSVLLSLFSGLNLGLVLLAYTSGFAIIKIAADFVPKNNLSRVLLILLALPISEMSLVYLMKWF